MNVVILGHVDHGKSTLVGRLMADTGCVPESKMASVRQYCESNAMRFEYAFLVDALEDERSQRITIDVARCFFKSQKRNYILMDAPGHVEFLRNMITGASRAEVALILLDAKAGIQENTKRHGLLAAMLGVRHLILVVNKMDIYDFQPERFHFLVAEYQRYLRTLQLEVKNAIPISALEGQGLIEPSNQMKWYHGRSVLETLDTIEKRPQPFDRPFRMFLQDTYQFSAEKDSRRIFAGRVEAGSVAVGDPICFLPSGKTALIEKIQIYGNENAQILSAGVSGGLTLQEDVVASRGELMCKRGENRPEISSRVRVSLFWIGSRPMLKGQRYFLKLGTRKVNCRIAQILKVLAEGSEIKSSSLEIRQNDFADVILDLDESIALDFSDDLGASTRFVIVETYEICGGGIFRESSSKSTGRKSKVSIWKRLLRTFMPGPYAAQEGL